MPIVIAMIVSLIVLLMYLSDRAYITAASMEYANAIAMKVMNMEEISQAQEEAKINSLIKDKTIIVKNIATSCNISKNFVDVEITSKYNMSRVGIIKTLLRKRILNIDSYSRARIIKPEELVRKTDAIKNILSKEEENGN